MVNCDIFNQLGSYRNMQFQISFKKEIMQTDIWVNQN